MNADKWHGSFSDPYCTCEVEGKAQSQVETPVAQNNLNPVWDHYAELEGYTFGDSLIFRVFDKDSAIKQDDFLGCAELRSVEFESSVYEGTLALQYPDPKDRKSGVGSEKL